MMRWRPRHPRFYRRRVLRRRLSRWPLVVRRFRRPGCFLCVSLLALSVLCLIVMLLTRMVHS